MEQIVEPRELTRCDVVVRRQGTIAAGSAPIGPSGRNVSERLPSGKLTSTNKTPRQQILLIAVKLWPSKA
jgi:hypothetical protein